MNAQLDAALQQFPACVQPGEHPVDNLCAYRWLQVDTRCCGLPHLRRYWRPLFGSAEILPQKPASPWSIRAFRAYFSKEGFLTASDGRS